MVFLVPGLVVFIAGVVLLVIGLRGRRLDDHPICRKCKFDVTGVYAGGGTASKCPECGAVLDSARAVRTGNRRRWRPAIVVGGLLLGAVLLVAYVIGWSQATKTNLNPYKPVWLLRYEARGAGQAAVECIDELEQRLTTGTLPEREIARVVVDALAAQAGESGAGAWHPEWAALFHRAMRAGRVTDEQRTMYYRNGIVVTPIVRPAARAGVPVPMQIVPSGSRLAPGTTALVKIDELAFRIGDGPAEVEPSGRVLNVSPSNRTWLRLKTTAPSADRLGMVEWTLDYRILVMKGPNEEGSVASWPGTLKGPIRVGPADVPFVRVIRDDSLFEKIRTAIRVESTSLMDRPPNHLSQYHINYQSLPEPVSFDVFWRWRDAKDVEHEILVGSMSCPKGEQSGFGESRYHDSLAHLPPELVTIDVVLRPSASAAERDLNVSATWVGSDIVFEDVLLLRAMERP